MCPNDRTQPTQSTINPVIVVQTLMMRPHALMKTHDWFMDLSIRPAEISAVFIHVSSPEESWGHSVSDPVTVSSKLRFQTQQSTSHQPVAVGNRQRWRAEEQLDVHHRQAWVLDWEASRGILSIFCYIIAQSWTGKLTQHVNVNKRSMLAYLSVTERTLLPCFRQKWHV